MDIIKEIAFTGSMPDIRPRMLWQTLFDLYRENNCDINNMDNMLIDYEKCKDVFTKLITNNEVKFLWGCAPNSFQTNFCICQDFNTYDLYVLSSPKIYAITCTYTKCTVEIYDFLY